MRTVCDYTDFFVIASGGNPRQTKSIHDEVHAVLKHEQGLFPRSTGGVEATWIVADYNDVVLHVFTPETRGFYRLEDLERRAEARGCHRLMAVGPRGRRASEAQLRRRSCTRVSTLRSVSGAVAQLGERLAGSQKVRGSSPLGSIGPQIENPRQRILDREDP